MQLCWDCVKYAGGCSWSRDFTPVPGWDATPTVKTCGQRPLHSFAIRGCPEFEREVRPKRRFGIYENLETM